LSDWLEKTELRDDMRSIVKDGNYQETPIIYPWKSDPIIIEPQTYIGEEPSHSQIQYSSNRQKHSSKKQNEVQSRNGHHEVDPSIDFEQDSQDAGNDTLHASNCKRGWDLLKRSESLPFDTKAFKRSESIPWDGDVKPVTSQRENPSASGHPTDLIHEHYHKTSHVGLTSYGSDTARVSGNDAGGIENSPLDVHEFSSLEKGHFHSPNSEIGHTDRYRVRENLEQNQQEGDHLEEFTDDDIIEIFDSDEESSVSDGTGDKFVVAHHYVTLCESLPDSENVDPHNKTMDLPFSSYM